jgi:aromatic ring-opening dioxygenase catalytic subunit (LigB family)
MPYCHTIFQTVKPEQVKNVLSIFARENFVGGQIAHNLNDAGFNIDAGENDIRAYYDEAEKRIKFICRDERDLIFYEKKLKSFANKHNIKTKRLEPVQP